jgi:excisionase family DNA binding protein
VGQIVYLSEVPKSQDVELFADQPDVMAVPKVASLLGVNAQTVRREIARGRLGCIHVGKAVRVTKKQLLVYVGEVSCNG